MALNLYASGGNGGLFSGNGSPNTIKTNFQDSPLGAYLSSLPNDNRTTEEKIRDMIASNPNTPGLPPAISRSPASEKKSTVNFVDPIADDDPIMLQNVDVPMDSYELKMAGMAPKVARPETNVNVKDVNAGLPAQSAPSTSGTQAINVNSSPGGLKNMIQGGIEAKDKIQAERDLELMRLLGMRDSMESSVSGKTDFDRMDLSPLMAFVDSMTGSKTQSGYRKPATGSEDVAMLNALNKQVNDYTKDKNAEQLAWYKAYTDAQKNDELLNYKLKSLENRTDPFALAAFRASLKGGSRVSSGDINTLAGTDEAMSLLDRVKQNVMANPDKIGPISGMARINPWSDTRQMQALIDGAKQIIGKGLEGGVLRKEDESKYAKILPTLDDTYETAMAKLAEIEKSIINKRMALIDNLEQGGYDVSGFNRQSSRNANNPSGNLNINQSALDAELAKRGL